MRVLLVGNGGREHAIAWKLRQSPLVSELYIAPGNAGTAGLGRNVPVGATDVDGLLRFAQDNGVGFSVVGPEAPLAAGIVDRFQDAGAPVFGPTREAALIESSKVFSKELMLRQGIPTAMSQAFASYEEARKHLESVPLPVVVKADGLAAGKGVFVARTRCEAHASLRRMMVEGEFGEAGERVLVEECLEGQEMSVFAFVDGEQVSPMVAARDYKRLGDGDAGPNTGGMGSYSPPQVWNAELERRVRREIMEPAARGMAAQGIHYRGVLYAGLMLTREGPKTLEFNCRLGDPETQVILPRLKTDLAEAMIKTAQGDLGSLSIELDARTCVGVVLASGGYPGEYATGHAVEGLGDVDDDAVVFHAGTKFAGGSVVTDGGRVLTVSALGATLDEARARAYANARRVRFEGVVYRGDIGA